MTDKPRVTLLNEGVLETGRGSDAPRLLLRCFQGRLEVFTIPGGYIGTGSDFATRVRFDGAAPSSQMWSAATSGKGVFASDPRGFTEHLVHATRVLIEVTNFNGEHFRMNFANHGLTEALPEIAACWHSIPPHGAKDRG
jgi:hypothetical protein